jgi:hypothetical protein
MYLFLIFFGFGLFGFWGGGKRGVRFGFGSSIGLLEGVNGERIVNGVKKRWFH